VMLAESVQDSKKMEVSSPEVGANVGDLFSNAMIQEKATQNVKYQRPFVPQIIISLRT
jgi:hypothetical protein